MAEIWVEFVDDILPFGRVAEFIHGDGLLGGIVIFEGATRRESDETHGALAYLEYEAYGSMASSMLRQLVETAMTRWHSGRVAVLHRLGKVYPSDVSVIVAVAAGHRAEAFDACRWLIDTLKTEVPIWKKEVYADGFVHWTESKIEK